jgi:hypothetical protein
MLNGLERMRATTDQHEWSELHRKEQRGVRVELARINHGQRLTKVFRAFEFHYRGACQKQEPVVSEVHGNNDEVSEDKRGVYDMLCTMRFG